MVVEVILPVLYFRIHFASTEVLLSVRGNIQNNSNSRSEVGRLAQAIEVSVLATAICPVSVNIIQLELDCRLARIQWQVV
jgi:hypothetical protein